MQKETWRANQGGNTVKLLSPVHPSTRWELALHGLSLVWPHREYSQMLSTLVFTRLWIFPVLPIDSLHFDASYFDSNICQGTSSYINATAVEINVGPAVQLPTGQRWCLAIFRWTPSRHWGRFPGPAVAPARCTSCWYFLVCLFLMPCLSPLHHRLQTALHQFRWMWPGCICMHLEDARLRKSSQHRETRWNKICMVL